MNDFFQLWHGRYTALRQNIFEVIDQNRVRGRGRGVLRAELELSVPRLRTILQGNDIEVTLQRCIVQLMNGDKAYEWFNELAVSAGIHGGNRYAVDILRTSQSRSRWDFLELKEWNSNDKPKDAAAQVLEYFCALSAIVERKVPPYADCPAKSFRLWLLAPSGYFLRHGGNDQNAQVLKRFHEGVKDLGEACPTIGDVSFMPRPLVLHGSMTRDGFLACFDKTKVQSLIDAGTPAPDPLTVLHQDRVPELRDWLRKSFADSDI